MQIRVNKFRARQQPIGGEPEVEPLICASQHNHTRGEAAPDALRLLKRHG